MKISKFESTPEFAAEWLEYKRLADATHDAIILPGIQSKVFGSADEILCDIGCGDGEFTRKIAYGKWLKVYGLDINETLLTIARNNGSQHFQFLECDIAEDSFPLEDESCDFIISNNVFMHLTNSSIKHVMCEIQRILKKSGRAIIVVTSFSWASSHYKLTIEDDMTYYSVREIWNRDIREHYRDKAVYEKLFSESMTVDNVFELTIPNDPRLDKRYLSKIGLPLYTVYELSKA